MSTSPLTIALFKSYPITIGYAFRSGKTIHFVNHQYTTKLKDEIDELTKECEAGSPFFYIEDGRATISEEDADPLAGMKAQMLQKVRAEFLAATQDPKKDMGTTQNTGRLEGIANSHSIAGLQVQSEAQGLAARTIQIAKPTAIKL